METPFRITSRWSREHIVISVLSFVALEIAFTLYEIMISRSLIWQRPKMQICLKKKWNSYKSFTMLAVDSVAIRGFYYSVIGEKLLLLAWTYGDGWYPSSRTTSPAYFQHLSIVSRTIPVCTHLSQTLLTSFITGVVRIQKSDHRGFICCLPVVKNNISGKHFKCC